MNYIWAALILISIIFSILNGRTDQFISAMVEGVISAVRVGALIILPGLAIWMGLTKILEDLGFIHKISGAFRPLVRIFFKNVPKDHPVTSSITLNFLANMFGLGNAATPIGIRAMKELQSLNRKKDTISDDMMMFIVINTASIQLIPFSVITILVASGSAHPQAVILPVLA
ncbi:MAG: nucleoside recognition domain-containing protein, partial [Candidatus Firestonebacteria bacterium]